MPRLIARHLHARDVDISLSEHATDDSHDARLVVVAEEGHVIAHWHIDIEAIDIDDLRGMPGTGDRTRHADLVPVGERERHANDRSMVIARAVGRHCDLNPTLLGKHRRVHE